MGHRPRAKAARHGPAGDGPSRRQEPPIGRPASCGLRGACLHPDAGAARAWTPRPLPKWATGPGLRPPATVRPAMAPGDPPVGIGRPASCGLRGACPRPPASCRDCRASCPPAAAGPPIVQWGGPGRREQIYGRRCAALVLVSQPPPPAPPVPGGVRGVAAGPPAHRRLPVPASAAARPHPVAPPPPDRPRCHAAAARLGPGLAPAFGRGALARPFRAGPRPARAPRPPPARAAARPPCRAGRGLQRAASVRPVSLIIHIFTVPEIPYFTGFSSRQARCFLVQSWVP